MAAVPMSDKNQLPISCDSHVVEAPEVFAGLVERFGDEAPRIASVGDEADAMVIPARGGRVLGAIKAGIASTRIATQPTCGAGRGTSRRPRILPARSCANCAGADTPGCRRAL